MHYVVRRALTSELGTAFTLLPHALNQAVPPESVVVAVSKDAGGILGVGVFSIVPTDTLKPGMPGDIFVLPSARRQGIGTAILEELRNALKGWGVKYLHTWNSSEIGTEPRFLNGTGFSPLLRVFHFEAETLKANEICTVLVERLRAGGRIPPGTNPVPLHSAERLDAVRLYAHHFQTFEHDADHNLNQALSDSTAHELSFALLLDGQMIGFILWKMDSEGVPKVDLWISSPRFRTGWPAILLLHASIARLEQLGYPRGRFECNEQTKATLNIARSIGAHRLKITARHTLEV
jgi:GNAT superfamily N-acetyltransferase